MYFVYMNVCVSGLWLVLEKVRRGLQMPWNWNYRSCEPPCGYWELSMEPKVLRLLIITLLQHYYTESLPR